MVASRQRPKGVRAGPFGLAVLTLTLAPTSIGYQDFAALLARQPAVAQRARAHLLASPFGAVQAAMFSFPQPIGTAIPEVPTYRLASLDPRSADLTGSIGADLQGGFDDDPQSTDFPTVNRALKGDLLIAHLPSETEPGGLRDLTPGRVKTVSFPRPSDTPRPAETMKSGQTASGDGRASANPTASAPQSYALASLSPAEVVLPPPDESLLDPIDDANPAVRLGRLYFGHNPVGKNIGTIQPWPEGEEPMLALAPAADPDLKQSAPAPAGEPAVTKDAKGGVKPNIAPAAGQTIAPKGEVTGAGQHPKSPAERLGLDAKTRVKAEKCLADAVYFESRGESMRGQMAVAQVVMNRVFSGFYPNNVCGVVYQNSNRRLACQFTFACDGIKDVVNEPEMWAQATRIAHETLDGKLWLPEIGKSTHYHAYWVHPSWVREMRKINKIGVHSFYRPRRWGDDLEVPGYSFVMPHAKL